MKKVFKGIAKFHAMGFKKQVLVLALSISAGIAYMDTAVAASPNQNPPALKASAPYVYVVKRGDTL